MVDGFDGNRLVRRDIEKSVGRLFIMEMLLEMLAKLAYMAVHITVYAFDKLSGYEIDRNGSCLCKG